MSSMHITVVSADRQQLDEIARALQGLSGDDAITPMNGGLRQLGAFFKPLLPNLLIVHIAHDPESSLELLEHIAQTHPTLAVIVVCEEQTPDFLLRAMRAGVREVVSTSADPGMLRAAVERIRRAFGIISDKKCTVLSFVSCKGGSGATFLAANLAHALADHGGKKVALFDLNLQFGDASLFLSDQAPASTLADVARGIHRLDAAFLASSMTAIGPNLSMLAAPEDPAQGMEVKPEHVDALLKLAREHYDFVVLDVGRSLDARTIKALDHADAIFVVLQLTLPFIRDGKRMLEVLSTLEYPKDKVNLIVNRYEKDGDISTAEAEQALGSKILRTIPNHYQAAAASVNQGIPVAKLARSSPLSRTLLDWSESYAGTPETEARNWLTRVFKRA